MRRRVAHRELHGSITRTHRHGFTRTEERWVTELDFGGSEQLCTRCIALSSDAEVPVAIDERPVSTWPEERTPNVRPDVFDHGSAERNGAEPDSRAFGNAPMIESTPARLADLSNPIQRVLVCHFMRPENQPVLLREIADGCDQIINGVALYRDICDSFEYPVKKACFDNFSVYLSGDSRTQRV